MMTIYDILFRRNLANFYKVYDRVFLEELWLIIIISSLCSFSIAFNNKKQNNK